MSGHALVCPRNGDVVACRVCSEGFHSHRVEVWVNDDHPTRLVLRCSLHDEALVANADYAASIPPPVWNRPR